MKIQKKNNKTEPKENLKRRNIDTIKSVKRIWNRIDLPFISDLINWYDIKCTEFPIPYQVSHFYLVSCLGLVCIAINSWTHLCQRLIQLIILEPKLFNFICFFSFMQRAVYVPYKNHCIYRIKNARFFKII